MKKLIVANWKMNPQTLAEARKLVSSCEHRMNTVSDHTEVVMCTPFVFLPALTHYTHHVKIGAQNISWQESGALTGEISGQQLNNFKVSHVIVGHSERRLYLGETDSVVNLKIIMALKHKITPIVCLGGDEDANKENIKTLVTRQFRAAVKGLEEREIKKMIYVYEPVFSISTMKNSEPETGEHAALMINHIYDLLESKVGRSAENIPVLYGGSVNMGNVHEYAQYPEIAGALVGAASLDPENFWKVIKEFNRESVHHY